MVTANMLDGTQYRKFLESFPHHTRDTQLSKEEQVEYEWAFNAAIARWIFQQTGDESDSSSMLQDEQKMPDSAMELVSSGSQEATGVQQGGVGKSAGHEPNVDPPSSSTDPVVTPSVTQTSVVTPLVPYSLPPGQATPQAMASDSAAKTSQTSPQGSS